MKQIVVLLRAEKEIGRIDPGPEGQFYVPRSGEEFTWRDHVYKVYRVESAVQLEHIPTPDRPWMMLNLVRIFLASTTEPFQAGDRF